MQDNARKIQSPAFVSSWLVYYMTILYLAGKFLAVVLLIVLMQAFPGTFSEAWFFAWEIVWVILVFVPYLLARLCKVCISSQEVTVTMAGRVLRSIPASRLQLMCMAGNTKEDVLCLSTLTIAQLAQKEEQVLSKSALTKYDVPLRKGKADWETNFAKDYFNRLRHKLFGFIFNKDVILLPAQSSLQYLLQDMHPQLPYRNLTETKNNFIHVYNNDLATTVPGHFQYTVQAKADGIHIADSKKEFWYMPAEQIQTVIRVDHFTGYHKSLPHHLPVFVVSSRSLQELAEAAPSQICGVESAQLLNHPELLATHYCLQQFLRWKPKSLDFCPMHITAENEALLQEHYPQAQWVDLSAIWRTDRS